MAQLMKTTVLSVLIFAICVMICHSQNQSVLTSHEPNSGYIPDADTAKDIAKAVMSHLLTPDDFKRKEFSDAVLKDGIWTVRYWEVKTRINFPLVIQIRQQTGGIISYTDPNA
jgi:hypothetical protein